MLILMNSTQVSLKLFHGFLIVCFTLMGCQKEAEKPASVLPAAVRDTSCEFLPTDGNAPPNDLANIAGKTQTARFGKSFEMSWFEAVKDTSMQATVEVIEKTGAQVFKSEAAAKFLCSPFEFLKTAPRFEQKKWNVVEDSMTKNSVLMGLYLAGTPPAILMRPDSNRWVLIHEFLHHLFEMERKKDPNWAGPFAAYQSQLTAEQNYNRVRSSCEKNMKKCLIMNLVTSFETYFDLHLTNLKNHAMEEVAIDSLMSEALANGQLKNIPDYIDDADWYIRKSAGEARSIISNLKSQAINIRELAKAEKKPLAVESMDRVVRNCEVHINALAPFPELPEAALNILRPTQWHGSMP